MTGRLVDNNDQSRWKNHCSVTVVTSIDGQGYLKIKGQPLAVSIAI